MRSDDPVTPRRRSPRLPSINSDDALRGSGPTATTASTIAAAAAAGRRRRRRRQRNNRDVMFRGSLEKLC